MSRQYPGKSMVLNRRFLCGITAAMWLVGLCYGAMRFFALVKLEL